MVKVKKPPNGPTEQQKQIMKGLADGLTHEQIADDLFLAKRTIDGYVAIMFKKFDAKNACELVTIAFRHKWIA